MMSLDKYEERNPQNGKYQPTPLLVASHSKSSGDYFIHHQRWTKFSPGGKEWVLTFGQERSLETSNQIWVQPRRKFVSQRNELENISNTSKTSEWCTQNTGQKIGNSKVSSYLSHHFFTLHHICMNNKWDIIGNINQTNNLGKRDFYIICQK